MAMSLQAYAHNAHIKHRPVSMETVAVWITPQHLPATATCFALI